MESSKPRARRAAAVAVSSPPVLTYTSELSDDYFASSNIIVDVGSSPSPMAVFRNPQNKMTEAWIISNGELLYLHYDPTQPTGWSLQQPFNSMNANEVVVAVPPDGVPTVFFNTPEPEMYCSWLQVDGTWSKPSPLGGSDSRKLQVTYTQDDGAPIVYAEADLNEINMYVWNSSPGWTFYACPLALNDKLTLDNSRMFMAGTSEQMLLGVAPVTGGPCQIFVGSPMLTPIPTYGFNVFGTNSTINFAQQILAMDVVSPGNNNSFAAIYWRTSGEIGSIYWEAVSGALSSTKFLSLSSVVSSSSNLSSWFGIDTDHNLWALRQTGWDGDITEEFNPLPMPIDSGISAVFCDMLSADNPSLFALDEDGNVSLYWQDVTTSLWMKRPVQSSTTIQYQATRYRTEVTLYDGNGNPMPSTTITVAVNSATELAVNNQYFLLDSETSATTTTDGNGKVTFASIADGLAPPVLTVSATVAGQPVSVTINPGQPVQSYLAGTGALPAAASAASGGPGGTTNTWTGATLQGAQSGGGPLVPSTTWNSVSADDAATSISSVANLYPQAPGAIASGSAGFTLVRPDAAGAGGGFTFHVSEEELQAALAQHKVGLVRATPGPDAIGQQIEKWWGDFVHGVKTAVMQVKKITVALTGDLKGLVNILIEGIDDAIQFTITCIEDAFTAIMAIFNSLVADIRKLIDWLKALFDFRAVMDSATAIFNAFTALPAFLKGQLQVAQQKYVSGWFQKQEQAVSSAFTQWLKSVGNQTLQSQAGPGWQAPGQPPSTSTPTYGPANTPPAGVIGNPHANWFMTSASSAVPSMSLQSNADLSDALTTLWSKVQDAVSDFQTTLAGNPTGQGGFAMSPELQELRSNPASIGQLALADLLNAIQGVVRDTLQFLDNVVTALLEFGSALLDALSALFSTPVPVKVLTTLYGWVWDLAVRQGWQAPWAKPGQITALELMSVVVGFPVTVLYKLIVDIDGEPFPGGAWTQPGSAEVATGGLAKVSLIVSALSEMISVIPASIMDLAGDDTPWFVTVGGLAFWLAADAFAWPAFDESIGVDVAMWLASVAQVVIDFIAPLAGSVGLGNATEILDQLVPVLVSVGGLVEIALAVIAATTSSGEDALTTAASFMTPLPSVFAFATITEVKEAEPVGPILLAIKVLLNVVGYAGGGGLELIDALDTE